MTQRTERVTKELTPFTLKLPEPFNLKPAHEIAVSATRTLLVYDTTVTVREHDADGNKMVTNNKPGWRTVIQTKRGTFIDHGGRYHSSNEGHVFTDPLLLCLYAQQLAVEYAKKKKTTVEETDLDD